MRRSLVWDRSLCEASWDATFCLRIGTCICSGEGIYICWLGLDLDFFGFDGGSGGGLGMVDEIGVGNGKTGGSVWGEIL